MFQLPKKSSQIFFFKCVRLIGIHFGSVWIFHFISFWTIFSGYVEYVKTFGMVWNENVCLDENILEWFEMEMCTVDLKLK